MLLNLNNHGAARRGMKIALTLIASLTINQTTFAGDDHDIVVGRTAAGQLAIYYDEFDAFLALSPVSGLLNGWTTTDPGFDALDADQPGDDFFQLQSGAQIRLEIVSTQPAFSVWTPTLSESAQSPGQSIPLGNHTLHGHPIWHVDSTDPAFQSSQALWTITFRLIDTGTTAYDPSESFTLRFVNRPIPAASTWGLGAMSLTMLIAGTLVLRAQRQRAVCQSF